MATFNNKYKIKAKLSSTKRPFRTKETQKGTLKDVIHGTLWKVEESFTFWVTIWCQFFFFFPLEGEGEGVLLSAAYDFKPFFLKSISNSCGRKHSI